LTLQEADLLIDRLLDGWEQALHNVDSLWQVVQAVPDWKSRLQAALDDSLRFRATADRFSPMKDAVRVMRAGISGVESMQRAFEKMQRTQ